MTPGLLKSGKRPSYPESKMLYYEVLERTRSTMFSKSAITGIYARDEYLGYGDMPPGIIAFAANRIWCEQDGKVVYVKHKGGDPEGREVDMKEFLMIKLTAEII